MPMFTSREEFYSALWDDYRSYIKTAGIKNPTKAVNEGADRSLESDISPCFYYRFIKNKKDTAAEEIAVSRELLKEYSEKPKRDKYTLLHGAYIAFSRNKVIDENEYRNIFMSIIGDNKKNSRKYLQLLDTDIAEADRQLEYVLLRGCVSDFFDNEGFKATGENRSSASRHRKEKHGYNDVIEMLYLYMHEKNMSANDTAKTAAISDDYIEKCSVLYSAALREKQTEAFIPLYFDHDSGAGIFIVGKELFEDEESIARDCGVCIIYFSELHYCEGLISSFDEIAIVMNTVQCDTVRNAFTRFSKEVSSYVYLENYAERNFRDGHYFCPDGIDKIFIPRLKYTEAEAPKKTAEATKKELKIMERASEEEERQFAVLKEKNL